MILVFPMLSFKPAFARSLYKNPLLSYMGFPGGSDGKESAHNAGDQVWEDPLEKGMAIHSSILAWRIPWTDHGVTKSQTTTEPLTLSLHFFFQKGK